MHFSMSNLQVELSFWKSMVGVRGGGRVGLEGVGRGR